MGEEVLEFGAVAGGGDWHWYLSGWCESQRFEQSAKRVCSNQVVSWNYELDGWWENLRSATLRPLTRTKPKTTHMTLYHSPSPSPPTSHPRIDPPARDAAASVSSSSALTVLFRVLSRSRSASPAAASCGSGLFARAMRAGSKAERRMYVLDEAPAKQTQLRLIKGSMRI